MNKLPVISPETPEWFLGEVEDLLETIKQASNKKKYNFTQIDQSQYLLNLPKRLFICGFITVNMCNTMQKVLHHIHEKSSSPLVFYKNYIFYIFKTGLLKLDYHSFKNTRDVLLDIVRTTSATKQGIQNQVSEIMKIDNKYYPEILPGEVVGPNGEIIDSIYKDMEKLSDKMIDLLQSNNSSFEGSIFDIYSFYGELLNHSYINEDQYSYFMNASGQDIPLSICVGLIHALNGGFYDHEPDTKEVIMHISYTYFLERREKSLKMWADEIFNTHDLVLPNHPTSP